MALNVCNWSDKQLDELVDMLRTADYSAVAAFIASNFLASGSKVLTDDTATTLRATVGVDAKTIVLSAGVFVFGGYVSQLDSNQTINILDTATGTWGTGQAVSAQARYDIVCVKNNEQVHTAANRWFVNDSVTPNTYAQASTYTLINKAYYDIVVVHGTPGAVPVVPDATAGYWTICEIYIPSTATDLSSVGVVIADTTGTSSKAPANWDTTTRVLRMEFWATRFAVDHDPTTGYHRSGGWHIGATTVLSTGAELNKLAGTGATVTAPNLTQLTDGSSTTLHNHGSVGWTLKLLGSAVTLWTPAGNASTAINLTPYLGGDDAKAAYISGICYANRGLQNGIDMIMYVYAAGMWTPIARAMYGGQTGEDEADMTGGAGTGIASLDASHVVSLYFYVSGEWVGLNSAWYLVGYYV